MKPGENWVMLIIMVSFLLVTNVSASDRGEAVLNELNYSSNTSDIREIINTSENSSEQLFGTFHNNPEALNTLPGLESMIGFIERMLKIMYDAADKITSYLP